MRDVTLMHYGISGQKWGIRRFENLDGTLTEEGKRRYGLYNDKGEYEIQRSAKTFYSSQKDEDKEFAKELQNEKASGAKVSKHREKLINMYKEKGLSQEDAELAALKRAKIEKTLMIAGGIALTAAAAYGTYKVHKLISDNADVVIPKGGDIFRVTGDASEELDRAGFVAVEAKDAVKYKGIFGQQLQKQKNWGGIFGLGGDDGVYQLSAKARNEIRVAGEGKGNAIYQKLMRTDPQFAADARAVGERWELNPMARKGDSYKAFNQRLVDHSSSAAERVQKKFYDALKKEGYGGVIDTNDRHDSGYDSKKPVILFNMKDAMSGARARKLSPSEIDDSAKKAWGMITKSSLMKMGVSALGVTAAGASINALNSISDLKIHELSTARRATSQRMVIQNYKKLHPGTKLSDKEILENELGSSNK